MIEDIIKSQKVGCVGTSVVTALQRDLCIFIGYALTQLGKQVLSGNAVGADFAYATGANFLSPELVTLYVPNNHHNIQHWCFGNIIIAEENNEWKDIARRNHNSYDYMNSYVKKLFNRNAGIVSNSDLIIALPDWSKKGGGGTGHDIRIARDLNIPVIDISDAHVVELLVAYFKSHPAIANGLSYERKRKT